MTPELKARWIEALRSGEYRQARNAMNRDNESYCCLGVLCLVGGVPADGGSFAYGFAWSNGVVASEYMALNDKRQWSFDQIADYIEANVS